MHNADASRTGNIKLSWALAAYLQKKGYKITHLINPNPLRLPSPPAKGAFPPDVVARGPGDTLALGLALVGEQLNHPETERQLIDYSTRFHKGKGDPVAFYIGIPNDANTVEALKRAFEKVHIDWKRTHIHIVRLTF